MSRKVAKYEGLKRFDIVKDRRVKCLRLRDIHSG